MTEKRFRDPEAYFANMLISLLGLLIVGLFPNMLFQIFVFIVGGIGFFNLVLCLLVMGD